MTDDEPRRRLVRRQPEITKTYRPPYTSLRQPEEEKIRPLDVIKVKKPTLPEERLASIPTELRKQFGNLGISEVPFEDLAWKISSAEKMAELRLKASEIAQQAEFKKQASEDLKEWQHAEVSRLDKQIGDELEKQGITKEDLRKNARLRRAVTEWKRGIIPEFKKVLSDAQKLAIEKASIELTEAQKAQRIALKKDIKLYEIDIKTGTTPKTDTKTEITPQQRATVQATYNKYESEGLIKKVPMVGPLQPGQERQFIYKMEKNYWEYSPSEQEKLKGVFDITPEIQKRNDVLKRLVSSGAVNVVSGKLVQNKPYLELNKEQVEGMSAVGFEMPSWETISKTKGLRRKGFIEHLPFGVVTTTNQIAKDVTGAINWLTKDADIFNLIPDTDIKFDGVCLDDFSKWVKLNPSPSEQAALIAANISLGIAEGVALDLAFTGGVTAVGRIAGKIGKFTVTKTGISKVASYIAKSEKLSSAVSKVPSFTYGKATVTNIAKWLTTHPNITALMIAAPVTGIQVGVAIDQLKRGVEPYDVAMQLGKNLGLTAGALLYNKIYTDAQRKVVKELVQERMISIDGVHTSKGFSLEFTTDLKKIPKKYAGLFETQLDPMTGKVVLTGFATTHSQKFPMTMEFTARQWDDIWKNMKYGPDALKMTLLKYIEPEDYYLLLNKFPEIAKMSSDDVFDILSNYKSVATTQMSPDEIIDIVSDFTKINKNIKPETVTSIIQKHPEIAKSIQSKMDDLARAFDDIGKVSEKELLDLLYKEIGDEGPWAQSLRVERGIVVGKKGKEILSFKIDIKAAFVSEDKRDMITETYKKFLSYGFDKDKASRLAIGVLSDDMGTVSKVLETTLLPNGANLVDDQIASIMALRFEAGGPTQNFSHVYRALKMGGVPDNEIGTVLEKYIKVMSEGSPTYTIDRSMLRGMGELSDKGYSALADMLGPEYITNFKEAPEILNRFVTVMTPKTSAKFITLLPTSIIPTLSTETLTNSLIGMEDIQLSSFVNSLSTEELTKTITNFDAKLTNFDVKLIQIIVPKLSSKQIPTFITAFSPAQLNSALHSLSTDQLQNILQNLNILPGVIQKYLQTGYLTTIGGVPPILLKRLFDESLKRKKKELKKQKITMFEVKLYYYTFSEQYKIKAKSFKGASVIALRRSKSNKVPRRVEIKKIQSSINN